MLFFKLNRLTDYLCCIVTLSILKIMLVYFIEKNPLQVFNSLYLKHTL